MCECGCAEQEYQQAFRIKGTKTVVSYQIFPGCADCDYGPSVSISFFDSPRSEWLEGLKIENVTPNEYGSGHDRDGANNGAGGFGLSIFDIEDLCAAAEELEESAPVEGYGSMKEWLEEYGHDLLRKAVWRRQDRGRKRGGRQDRG